MKIVTLKNNEWKEIVDPLVTEGEKAVLENTETSLEEREQIMASINSRAYQNLSPEETQQAQSIYEGNMLEGYNLIDVNITLPDGYGLINCRKDDDHKQIRF
jgi:hypothetical protein